MSEIFHVKRGGKIIRLPDLASIKAGEQYRISTVTFRGPWRTAATDAKAGSKRGTWHVTPTSSRPQHNNGYDGGQSADCRSTSEALRTPHERTTQLRILLNDHGLTARDAGALIGVQAATMSNYKCGSSVIPEEKLKRLVAACGATK